MSSYKLVVQGQEEKYYIPSNFQRLEQLTNYIKMHVKNCPSTFELKYKDQEDDWIILSSDNDLKFCPKTAKIYLYSTDDSFEIIEGEKEQFEMVQKQSSFKAKNIEDQYSMFYENGIPKPGEQQQQQQVYQPFQQQVQKPVVQQQKPVISQEKKILPPTQQHENGKSSSEWPDLWQANKEIPKVEQKPKPVKLKPSPPQKLSPEQSLAIQLHQFFGKNDQKYYENFTPSLKTYDFETVTSTIVKCEQIAQVMDSQPHKYINIVLKMDKSEKIENIIAQLLSETQLSQSTFPQYSPEIQEKAVILGQILNKRPKELYEFCKAKNDVQINELVEMCLVNPDILNKYK